MTRARHFQINYCFKKTRQMFIQPDSHMSDDDAWYYACLHAGVGLLYGEHHDQQNHLQLRAHAEKSDLTHVTWEELP
ncbi:DUF6555 family protein [Pseudomonas sp. O230]|uniref:DUF6555 family protein n=1 Tax=Pseudomonas sp. O230 TaxID=3159450 RepID=UPI00387AC03A